MRVEVVEQGGGGERWGVEWISASRASAGHWLDLHSKFDDDDGDTQGVEDKSVRCRQMGCIHILLADLCKNWLLCTIVMS